MDHKQELLALAFKQAKAIKAKIAELEITQEMEQDKVDVLITSMAKDKAETSGKPYTAHLSGMEWYIKDLQAKSIMKDEQLLQNQYNELLPANSSFEELTRMLSC